MTVLMSHAKSGPSTNNTRKRESESPVFLGNRNAPQPKRRCNIVEELMNNRTPNLKLRTVKGIELCGKDFWTLKPGEWLNDQVMNAYLELIKERSVKNPRLPKVYAFSTFFYTKLSQHGFEGVRRWTSRFDIFSYDLLLFPIHYVDHWSLIAIDLKKDVYGYFDSMEFSKDQLAVKTGKMHIKKIYNYMKAESLDKRDTPYVRSHSKASTYNSPIQLNETDCGAFVCCFAENLARGNNFGDFDFTQHDMPRLRRQICYELGDGRLIK